MSDTDLRGKVAVVTGGATGIGLAASLAFARCGAAVAVNYSRNAEAADAAVKEIRRLGVAALAIRTDVSNDGEVRGMMGRVAKELGGVDFLVNNAGWTKRVQPHSDLEGLTDDVWDRVWAVNVKGAFYCVRAGACAGPPRRGLRRQRDLCSRLRRRRLLDGVCRFESRADDAHEVTCPRSRADDSGECRRARSDPDRLRRVDRRPLEGDVRADTDPAPAHSGRDGSGDLLSRDGGRAHGPDDRRRRRAVDPRPRGGRRGPLTLRRASGARAIASSSARV